MQANAVDPAGVQDRWRGQNIIRQFDQQKREVKRKVLKKEGKRFGMQFMRNNN